MLQASLPLELCYRRKSRIRDSLSISTSVFISTYSLILPNIARSITRIIISCSVSDFDMIN